MHTGIHTRINGMDGWTVSGNKKGLDEPKEVGLVGGEKYDPGEKWIRAAGARAELRNYGEWDGNVGVIRP